MSFTEDKGIVRFTTPSPRSRVRVIQLDGVEVRRTSRDALALAGITDGCAYTSTELESALEAVEPASANSRAISLLAQRERSAAEVFKRLTGDGYPSSAAREAVDRSVELGLIDDARFAEAYARTKAASRWGRERIANGLDAAGIDRDTALAALDSAVPIDGEIERATSILGPLDLHDRKVRERHVHRLVSRGFRYPDAMEAVIRASTATNRNQSDS
ncbi:MAG: RecX family transcriptional regulator [Clostridiales bacterium]|nr:RecX family transcriptional regulator [Clostridiales bacterium]